MELEQPILHGTWHTECECKRYVWVFGVFANIINWNCAHALTKWCVRHSYTLPNSKRIISSAGRIVFRFPLSFSLLFYDYLINLSILWLFLLSVLKYSNLGTIRQDFLQPHVLIACACACARVCLYILWYEFVFIYAIGCQASFVNVKEKDTKYKDMISVILQYFSLSFMARLGEIQFTQLKKCI